MSLRGALGALSLGTALLASAPAHAYCRAKACDTKAAYDDVWQEEPDPSCGRDAYGCQIEGPPLHWPQTCLSFTVQNDGSPLRGIDYDAVHDIAVEAFETWLAAECGPSFVVRDYGAVECNVPQYNQTNPNANVIMFRDDGWDKEWDGFNTLALTTLSYNTETAEIYDADIEINSADWPFVVSDTVTAEEIDLRAVLTHEVGHFLGLSHSDEPGATMWAHYVGGETQQRTLHPDDIEGICDIYPPGRAVDPNHCEPRHGFSGECQTEKQQSGCALASPAGQNRVLGVAFGWLAVFGLLRRRQR